MVDGRSETMASSTPSASAADFRDLANLQPQLTWIADATGFIFWYNARWHAFTGRSFEAMQGRGWRAVHHPDHVERVVANYERAFRLGDVWEDTFPLLRHDGVFCWFLSRAEPMRDATGRSSAGSARIPTSPSSGRPSSGCERAKGASAR